MNETLRMAVVAVTWNCNSRCIMCNIWKQTNKVNLPTEILKKLPASLKHIDITGGEPFLHPDLEGIVRTLRDTCPKARLLITTNGLAPALLSRSIKKLLEIDPKLAFRLSLDGWETVHDQVRGVEGAFKRVQQSIQVIKKFGGRDVGVIYTLTKQNKSELLKVFEFTRQNGLDFSLNFIHDSPVYFGEGHSEVKADQVDGLVKQLIWKQLWSMKPKDWLRAGFNGSQLWYQQTHKRPLPCDAARRMCYIDPVGDVYACHFQPWKLGNLINQSLADIWSSSKRGLTINKAGKCNECWMMCTVKSKW